MQKENSLFTLFLGLDPNKSPNTWNTPFLAYITDIYNSICTNVDYNYSSYCRGKTKPPDHRRLKSKYED